MNAWPSRCCSWVGEMLFCCGLFGAVVGDLCRSAGFTSGGGCSLWVWRVFRMPLGTLFVAGLKWPAGFPLSVVAEPSACAWMVTLIILWELSSVMGRGRGGVRDETQAGYEPGLSKAWRTKVVDRQKSRLHISAAELPWMES